MIYNYKKIFKDDALEIVIRFEDNMVENRKIWGGNAYYKIKKWLDNEIINCLIWKKNEREQIILIPLEREKKQIKLTLRWQPGTFDYKAIIAGNDEALIHRYQAQQVDLYSIEEKCIIKFIPVKESYNSSKKVEEFFNKARSLEISPALLDEYQEEIQGDNEEKVTSIDKKPVPKIDKDPKKKYPIIEKNTYIIDTNIFIEEPNIINHIVKNHCVKISARVIEELDKLKNKKKQNVKDQKELNTNASEAIKNIYKLKNKKIIETCNIENLPIDFRKNNADNMILSLALKYKDNNPILITNDKAMQLKAQALNIATQNLIEFKGLLETSNKNGLNFQPLIRLSKMAQELNVNIEKIVELVAKEGLYIDSNPNNKIPEDVYEKIKKVYS